MNVKIALAYVLGTDGFWHVFGTGKEPQKPIPLDRWNSDDVYAPPHTTSANLSVYTRTAATLCDGANGENFDATFFRLLSSEALMLDPHARLLLEQLQERFPFLQLLTFCCVCSNNATHACTKC